MSIKDFTSKASNGKVLYMQQACKHNGHSMRKLLTGKERKNRQKQEVYGGGQKSTKYSVKKKEKEVGIKIFQYFYMGNILAAQLLTAPSFL